MRINTRVPGRSGQILVLLVRNVEMSPRISVLFSESKVNHIDLISAAPKTHEKVVWLDVSVEKVFRMNEFYPGNLSWPNSLARRFFSTESL